MKMDYCVGCLPKSEYVMYVDASGDDGTKLEAGSSLQYAVSCFLMRREDIQHNTNILFQIKFLMGAREKDEVKYSKVHRHPKKEQIHALLKNVKGYLSSSIVFKKEVLHDTAYMKSLGGLSHALSILFISFLSKELGNSSVAIYVDRMKQKEMRLVEYILGYHKDRGSNLPSHTIEFKDSKAAGYELIQMADIFAGITRRYFENTLQNSDIQLLIRKCPLCYMVPSSVFCRKDKQARHRALRAYYMNSIIHLLKNTERICLNKSLFIYPQKNISHYWYFFCTKR